MHVEVFVPARYWQYFMYRLCETGVAHHAGARSRRSDHTSQSMTNGARRMEARVRELGAMRPPTRRASMNRRTVGVMVAKGTVSRRRSAKTTWHHVVGGRHLVDGTRLRKRRPRWTAEILDETAPAFRDVVTGSRTARNDLLKRALHAPRVRDKGFRHVQLAIVQSNDHATGPLLR